MALANSLARMLPHIGEVTEYAHLILEPLELLLSVEEVSVREAAAKAVSAVADELTPEQYQTRMADMIGRLAQQEWFTSRISAIVLLVEAHGRLTASQQETHLGLFARLATDETPMVRRVAARFMGNMVLKVAQVSGREALSEQGSVVTMLVPLLEEFASNAQPDSVRLQTTENCVAFGKILSEIPDSQLNASETALLERVVPLIVATIDDRSWRVRWTAAAKFADVIEAYGALPEAMDSLVPAFEKLLQDPEAEVRTAATLNLAHVARNPVLVPEATLHEEDADATNSNPESVPRVSVAERLVRRVTHLTEDDSEHVRSALAQVATELAPILGRDGTITFLVPPILLLLRDAASQVRLNLIASLGSLNEVIDVDLLSQSLLPAILDLAQDGKWRIRLSVIQHIPLLARQLGEDFVTERLASLCVAWLGDDIASIRQAAAENLKELTLVFGTNWALEHIIPSLEEVRQSDSYLRRLTALRAYSLMATAMDPNAARSHALPLILDMLADRVPNVRFNLAKELEAVTLVCGAETYRAQVIPVLEFLREDDDRDVRFYAEQTSASLEEKFSKLDSQSTE